MMTPILYRLTPLRDVTVLFVNVLLSFWQYVCMYNCMVFAVIFFFLHILLSIFSNTGLFMDFTWSSTIAVKSFKCILSQTIQEPEADRGTEGFYLKWQVDLEFLKEFTETSRGRTGWTELSWSLDQRLAKVRTGGSRQWQRPVLVGLKYMECECSEWDTGGSTGGGKVPQQEINQVRA